jgi:hypothetical protein
MFAQSFARTGVLLFKKAYSTTYAEWQGPLTLADETQLRMIAKGEKEKGYAVEVRDPASNWKLVTSFELSSFSEDVTSQDVEVPNIGSLRAYVGKTKSKNAWCIRIKILDEKGQPPAPRPW